MLLMAGRLETPGLISPSAYLRKSGISRGLRRRPPLPTGLATHACIALRSDLSQLFMSLPSLSKTSSVCNSHPCHQDLQVCGLRGNVWDWDLMCAPETFEEACRRLFVAPSSPWDFGEQFMGQRGRNAFLESPSLLLVFTDLQNASALKLQPLPGATLRSLPRQRVWRPSISTKSASSSLCTDTCEGWWVVDLVTVEGGAQENCAVGDWVKEFRACQLEQEGRSLPHHLQPLSAK